MKNLRRFFTRRQNLFGLLIVVFFLAVAAAAPRLAPAGYMEEVSAYKLVDKLKGRVPFPPSAEALLGTVPTGLLGKQLDVFHTLVWGARSALRFGLLVALGTALVGVFIGALSGFLGGWANQLIMRLTDAFLTVPVIVGIVVFENLFQTVNQFAARYNPGGGIDSAAAAISPLQALLKIVDPVVLGLVLFSWMAYARMTNTLVLRLKETAFVEAARALGASPMRIILRHLIPNAISPAIVLAARDIGAMVLMQATLTFIGLGGDSEWGNMLYLGRRWVLGPGGDPFNYWWVFIPGTLVLVLFGVGWNLLGDGLNDWLNPWDKQERG